MTDQITVESLQAEILRLQAHANELLSERKAEKVRREAAENALQTAQEAAQSNNALLDDIRLTQPVLRALESITAAPAVQGKRLLEEAGIKFGLGKFGTPVAYVDDEEIALMDLRQHLSKKCESPEGMAALGWILKASGTTGGGAMGSGSPGQYQPIPKPAAQAPVQKLGLR